jgi:hypothetical protein
VNFVTDKGYVHLGSRGTRIVVYCSFNPMFWFDVTGFEDENDKTFTIHVKDMDNHPLHVADRIIHHLTIKNLKDGAVIVVDDSIPDLPFTTFQLDMTDPHKPVIFPVSFIITAHNDLYDAIEIDIFNTTSCIGKILVFDVGYLSYELVSGGTTHLITIENGAVISATPGGGYFTEEPIAVFHQDNLLRLFFNIIQLQPQDETTAGPGGSYKFILKYDTLRSLLNDDLTYIFKQWEEIENTETHIWHWSLIGKDRLTQLGSNVNFKVQILGEYADVWRDFFCSSHYYPDQECFGQYSDDFETGLSHIPEESRDAFYGTLFYKLNAFYASVALYVCGINMEVI